ncbi:MAG: glycoside hydrolase [Bacteroidales bacterium]|nr:glycoside hydrolase [Bacteroidales bacterium]MBQ2091468.1 glycoside hydrolase [Bacteroidales bacterium]MDT3360973.1 glycoside hydrolase [Bacteroidota bacterium]
MALGFAACSKSAEFSIPAPKPVDEVIPDDDEGGGSGGGGGTTPGTLCTDIGQTPVILAYYTENSSDLPDVTLLTHINYAHGRFKNPSTGDGGIVISGTSLMKQVIALKSVNPKLKVMLMIGGWGIKADGFSMMARDADKRTEFCKSVKSLLDEYGLDGVDIDWEYPTYSAEGTGASAADKGNFNLVLKELRETLGTSKIISFASSSSAKYVDWPIAIQYIDYVNVMTYDMGAAPNGHNSPLYRSAKFNHRSCDESIELHLAAGIPLNRMNLGVPFYGKAEKNPSEANKVYNYEVNYNEMYDILHNNWYKKRSLDVTGKNNRAWDDVAKVPFLTDNMGRNLLSYDDPESVTCKGQYVVEKKLLGAMFWEYRHDDDQQSLLKALVSAVYGKSTVMDE